MAESFDHKPPVVQADIEATDRPDARRGEGGGHLSQVVGPSTTMSASLRINTLVPRQGGDIDQVRRLAVHPVHLVVDDEVDGEAGMAGLEVAHHGDGGGRRHR